MYCIQHCFIFRPSDSTVSEDVGSNPGLLRLRHWRSDALNTRLDLISFLFISEPLASGNYCTTCNSPFKRLSLYFSRQSDLRGEAGTERGEYLHGDGAWEPPLSHPPTPPGMLISCLPTILTPLIKALRPKF